MIIARPISKQPIPNHARVVFHGQLFDVYQWEQKLFNGKTAIFEKIKRPDTVVVFPVLPDGRILLTDQEQPGSEVSISATGGRVDAGEDILTAAKRELLEESGYEADEFILWDAQHPVIKIDWVVYTFVAKGLRKVADLRLDGGERITPRPVSLDQLIDLAASEKFAEKEIVPRLLEAKIYPEKKEVIRTLFKI